MAFDSLRETDTKGYLKEKIMTNENASHSPPVIWKISETTRVQQYVTDN